MIIVQSIWWTCKNKKKVNNLLGKNQQNNFMEEKNKSYSQMKWSLPGKCQ